LRFLVLLLLGLTETILAAGAIAIGLIIDDLGYDLTLGRRTLALPGALTYAILPYTPYAQVLAEEAHTKGKEVMVHLPMEADNGAAMGQGGLSLQLTEPEFRRVAREGLRSIPYARGVNNHVGSLLTREVGAMKWFMSTLAYTDGLYFVNSRTDDRTVAQCLAEQYGVPATRRDVFLDNQRDTAHIASQLDRLIAWARDKGTAVGIAHPRAETIEVLGAALPTLAEKGVGLLPISRIMEYQRRPRAWRASSSLSPPAAKNSKP
jgi:polysaccharide deacetylase 2 family uncharacterized protein YibQ